MFCFSCFPLHLTPNNDVSTCDDEFYDKFEMQGRIQGFLKGVHMYKCVVVRFADLNIP